MLLYYDLIFILLSLFGHHIHSIGIAIINYLILNDSLNKR